jgi:2-iminobutanoate/2-iminopropanoate deaminase
MSNAVGPYSPITRTGEWIIVSGQIGHIGGALVEGGLEPQLRQLFNNLRRLLVAEGAGLSDIVKTTVFLTDIDDYAQMNTIYIDEFEEHRPSRSAVAVSALPLGATVEIEAWAKTNEI